MAASAYRRERIQRTLQRVNDLKMAFENRRETAVRELEEVRSAGEAEFVISTAKSSVRYWSGLVEGMEESIKMITEDLEL